MPEFTKFFSEDYREIYSFDFSVIAPTRSKSGFWFEQIAALGQERKVLDCRKVVLPDNGEQLRSGHSGRFFGFALIQ